MDLHNSRFFVINKFCLQLIGLWPYQNSRSKFFGRAVSILIVGAAILPQIFKIYKNYTDIYKIFESLSFFFLVSSVFLKIVTSILAQDKLRVVFDTIIVNWKKISDEKERAILVEYSERGRQLTIFYAVYIIISIMFFLLLPIIPFVLDKVNPLNESRRRIYLLNGEYLVFDSTDHYIKMYFFDMMITIVLAFIIITIDTMFAACVEHSVGLFNIIKYRLKNCTKQTFNSNVNYGNISYDSIVRIIELHNDTINFTNILELTFSMSFLMLIGLSILFISSTSVLVIMSTHDPAVLLRHITFLIGMKVHLFFNCWPGQKLIDHSDGIFSDAYNNEWYESSVKFQKALQFLTIRSIRPCRVTAGGIFILNFEIFIKVIKMSVSYMTLFSSFK